VAIYSSRKFIFCNILNAPYLEILPVDFSLRILGRPAPTIIVVVAPTDNENKSVHINIRDNDEGSKPRRLLNAKLISLI
jgi:hypothetical protein